MLTLAPPPMPRPVRRARARALALLAPRSRRAFFLLCDALRDEDALVREHAAGVLGRLGDRRAVPALELARPKTAGASRR
ncbi:MAG TPA: HEAT repeat domain-containing protein, partial [Polyangiaceae bacterium LLY-WYZ-15_(1-7)]|nr:HEAT repeat domain-containing protein [Polyangiaceae bacterium LLY-WYZ-15_(1-7)]